MTGKMVPDLARAMERNNQFEYSFLISCRHSGTCLNQTPLEPTFLFRIDRSLVYTE